jgi:hypothetical protein
MSENIHTVIRIRPLNKREKKDDSYSTINIDTNTINIDNHTFIFDNVFNQESSQEIIFDKVAQNVIEWVVQGYNATILAYGSTGTGKSFTMFGNRNEQEQGIIPRSCDELFKLLNNTEDISEYTVKCSFLEIYCENIKDLLNGTSSAMSSSILSSSIVSSSVTSSSIVSSSIVSSLRIRQNSPKGIYVQDLTEKTVISSKEILDIIQQGTNNRSIASTSLNDVSSRSHAVITLTISQLLNDGSQMLSKLHLVDLAGSENVGKSEVQGCNLVEAQMINKSLSSLGNVIYALSEKGREHIPYRDSRLTYLLQDSLGGNSKTVLIATLSPHITSYSETLNTLKFASRAKEIKNIPKVNRNESYANLVKTVASLTRKLAELQTKYDNIIDLTDDNVESKEVNILKRTIETLKKEIEDNKIQQEQRYEQLKEIFDKQRNLAKMASNSLYEEKVKVYSMNNELEQYKMMYDSLKNAIDTPTILALIVKNTNIRRKSLSIKTNIASASAEIDSPV